MDGATTQKGTAVDTSPNPSDDADKPDPRTTITDELAAQLAASDKTYRKRAAAAAQLDAWLARGAA